MSLYKLICSEFNVNEDWLLNGTGEMFANDKAECSTLIDQIMDGEDEFAKNIFKMFTEFDKEDWAALRRVIKKCSSLIDDASSIEELSLIDEINSIPDTPEELERQFPPVERDDSDVG